MGSAESKRAREIFADALRRDPQERYDFISAACAGQPGLRADVAALLDELIACGQQTEELAWVPPARTRTANRQPGGGVVGPAGVDTTGTPSASREAIPEAVTVCAVAVPPDGVSV